MEHNVSIAGQVTWTAAADKPRDAPPPPFDSIRARIREAWTTEKIDDRSEQFIEELMDRYEVVIEDGEAPVAVTGRSATP